jgi:deoxyribonuclease-4
MRVGAHYSKNGIINTIEHMATVGMSAVQIYVSPNQNMKSGTKFSDKEVEKILHYREHNNLYMVVHGKLLYNFVRPNASTQWQKNSLILDLIEANRINANVIIHQGKNLKEFKLTNDEAMDQYVQNLEEILDETKDLKNKIILENSSRQGTEMGYTLDDLEKIYNKFKTKERIGFCIDLCHVFVSGELDVRSPDKVNEFFLSFEKKFGRNKLEVIHFNDSRIKFNGKNDNHGDLLVGFIGNTVLDGNPNGFKRVVEIATEWDVPLILETKGEIPAYEQAQLMLNWDGYIDEYINKFGDIITKFGNNPKCNKSH